MKSLHISKVIIKNYRNFKEVDVRLAHKQVIIGENNVGKTNFLRALQLVLDPSFSDEDRYLDESDFYDGLKDPMESQENIEISIYISGYKNNKNILAQLSDATVKDGEDEVLLITYKYYPVKKENGDIEYQYNIFKAGDESKKFTHEDRKFINIKVIKAIRDVEGEMKNSKTSPINKLLKSYSIDKEDLKGIAEKLKDSGADVLALDEIVDLENNMNSRFTNILGLENDFNISLKTMDIDPSRLLNSLNILLSERSTNNVSLGLNNILYISLILLMLQDKTVPSYLKKSKYEELRGKTGGEILEQIYEENDKGNYFTKDEVTEALRNTIYSFMDRHDPKCDGITILAIEEPEAHLHPIYQRLIFKDVIRHSSNSVLLTTHSTHITSIAPINSIVHLRRIADESTRIMATASLAFTPGELLDLERYVDVKRGEIYFGKGVILVEGIAEEYIIPKFADILKKPLDEKGIIVCNVNSTNFKPYVKMLTTLDIPFVVITDGDFYYENTSEEGEVSRDFHVMHSKSDKRSFKYLGNTIVGNTLTELNIIQESDIPETSTEQDIMFNKFGFYIGLYTLEVDIMSACSSDEDSKKVICETFNNLTDGGTKQKSNFKNELDSGEYWKCLSKIESNGIGKGRFAQNFSAVCGKEHIPGYISSAIKYIYKKVDGQ